MLQLVGPCLLIWFIVWQFRSCSADGKRYAEEYAESIKQKKERFSFNIDSLENAINSKTFVYKDTLLRHPIKKTLMFYRINPNKIAYDYEEAIDKSLIATQIEQVDYILVFTLEKENLGKYDNNITEAVRLNRRAEIIDVKTSSIIFQAFYKGTDPPEKYYHQGRGIPNEKSGSTTVTSENVINEVNSKLFIGTN